MLEMQSEQRITMPLASVDLSVLFSGSALWALAFYVPLSGPLSRFEAELITAGLGEVQRQLLLIISSVIATAGVCK